MKPIWRGSGAESLGTGQTNMAGLYSVSLHLVGQLTQNRSYIFRYLLPGTDTDQSNTIRYDRVIANSDGAFIIKTNKKGGGIGRLIWDKQNTAIAFDVMFRLPIYD